MRRRLLIAAVALLASTGCAVNWLRRGTIHQGSTLPELQYQQVLDNLAQFAVNPHGLPWHMNLREGTTQVTDSVTGGAAVDLSPPAATTQPTLLGSRTFVAQWGMSPVVEPTALKLLRIAYRRALGVPDGLDAELGEELVHELKNQLPPNADQREESEIFYEYAFKASHSYAEFDAKVATTNDDDALARLAVATPSERSPLARSVARQVETIRRELDRIGPGWYHVGRKRDVPRDACYVGHRGDVYVWVCPDGLEALTRFTLTAMKFASLIKESPTLISPGSVKFSPGDEKG